MIRILDRAEVSCRERYTGDEIECMDVIQLLDTCIALKQEKVDDKMETMFGIQSMIGAMTGKEGQDALAELVSAMHKFVEGT